MYNYAKQTGIKDDTEYYQCNRSGVYKTKGQGKRRIFILYSISK